MSGSFLEVKAYQLYRQVNDGFHSLRGSPKELTTAYILKFLDSYSYFSFRIILTLFLSSDFGYTDVQAGSVYGMWGALITVYGLFSGCIMDYLGVASSLRLGFAISLLSRLAIFTTTSRTTLLIMIGIVLPFGNSLGIPVLATGIRRYTRQHNRGFAFGMFYVVMNLAALVSGPIVDMCTILYKTHTASASSNDNFSTDTENQEYIPLAWKLTGFRLVILTGTIANFVALLVSMTVREIKVQDDAEEEIEEDHRVGSTGSDQLQKERGVASFELQSENACTNLKETLTTPSFWRFLVVCMLTINLRMIFTHLDATFPKYMVREYGDTVAKGSIYAINPAIIIFLVPIIAAATTKSNPLLMIHHGGYISALSVFFLVLSTSIPACILFITVLSLGEAIWSPRLYDYTMSVTKEGREGIYMALSSAPLFLAKLPVGIMSGYLLEKYCPPEGPRNSKIMWLIIGLTTITSPVLLTCCWGYISNAADDNTSKLPDISGKEKANDDFGSTDRSSSIVPLIPAHTASNRRSPSSLRGAMHGLEIPPVA
jgi:POT family proton-dependent oligopeptide transporter